MVKRNVLCCFCIVFGQLCFAGNTDDGRGGMSKTKKVLIGGALAVGMGTTVVVAGPAIAVAGTAAAAKTTITVVATKAAIVAAAAKVTVGAQVAWATVTGGLVVAAPYVTPVANYVKKARLCIAIKQYFESTIEKEIKQLKKEFKENPFEDRLAEAFEKTKSSVEAVV